MHTVNRFQVWLHNSYNLKLVICLHTVCSIWAMDKTLSGATTPDQSVPGNKSNEGLLHISQISKAGDSPSDCLMSYLRHSLGWRYSRCILQPQPTGLLKSGLNKSPQIPSALLSILTDLNSVISLDSSFDLHFPHFPFPGSWGMFQGYQLQLV